MNPALILTILTSAAQLLPEIEGLAGVVEKAINGQQFNDADLVALKAIADALDAKITAAVAAATPAA